MVKGVVLLDLATSLVSSCLLFSVLGHLAASTKQAVPEYLQDDGASMLYVLISELIGQLEYPQLWATLFALALLQLGLNQAVSSRALPCIPVPKVTISKVGAKRNVATRRA